MCQCHVSDVTHRQMNRQKVRGHKLHVDRSVSMNIAGHGAIAVVSMHTIWYLCLNSLFSYHAAITLSSMYCEPGVQHNLKPGANIQA